LAIDPRALEHLSLGYQVAVVSGTNGKTTTTSMLAAALATVGPVVTNAQGANLLPGLAAALAAGEQGGAMAADERGGAFAALAADERGGAMAALEVDEAWMARVVAATRPKVALLLNLSRDQLDRNNEVRRLAGAWRDVFAAPGAPAVVANADDPLVAWGAGASHSVTWVGAGQPWTADASGCPSCGGRILFRDGSWACAACSFRRPELTVWIDGDEVVTAAGERYRLHLQLPGRCNAANAALALTTARRFGAEPGPALDAMGAIAEVGGRYRSVEVGATTARLLLAKNPAGWTEVFDLLAPSPGPVVVAINARIADGQDPSWLWDVPFERLVGRFVVATGERGRDLAVRLHYAGVEHVREDDMVAAVTRAGPAAVDVVANYTSFQTLARRLGGR
jgi:UDP-N-acetylmuramyl tripeptide synthase